MIEKDVIDIWERKSAEDLMSTLAYTKLMELQLIYPNTIMAVDDCDIDIGDEINISKSEMVVGDKRMEIKDENGIYRCFKKEYGHIFLVKK